MPLYPQITSTVEAAAGVARAQWAVLDQNGFPQGSTGSISNGSSAPLSVYVAVKKAGGPASTPRIVYSTGDNGRNQWSWVFNAADIAKMDLSFAALDQAALAAFTGTKIHSIGQWDAVGVETNTPPSSAQIMILANIDAQDGSSGTFGQHRFMNPLWMNCTVFPTLSAHDEATPAEFAYTAQPTKVGRYPWGIAFSKAQNGFSYAARDILYSDFPLTMHTYIGNGGGTATVTLTYSPTTDQTGQGVLAWNATTGTPITITTVNIATRTVTFPDQPAGNVVVIVYEAFDLLQS